MTHVTVILSQWAWFRMSTRNFIGFGQSSAHPLQDDRWIARSAITRGSCVFNAREHCVSRYASLRKGNYARDERHAMILGFWIETFIFIRGVFIQMTLMK